MSFDKQTQKPISIWYLLRYFKGYWGAIIATLLFMALSKIATSFDPIYLKKIIDGVTSQSSFKALLVIIFIYFALKIITALFEYLRDLIFAPAEMGIARTLSTELFSHLLTLPINYHHNQKIGGLSRKITRGGRAVSFILDFMIINILPTIFELIFVTILLYKLYAPIYALITFSTIIIYTWFTIWATEKRQKYRLGMLNADDEVAGLEVDSLTNIETIKYFNNEITQLKRYQPLVDNRYNLSVASNKLFALISGVQGIILLAGLGLILFLAIRQALNGIITIGDLVLLTTYIMRLSAPIGVLGFIYRQIKDGLADLDGMAKILNEPQTIKEPSRPTLLKNPQGKIVFDNVCFGYSSKREILKDINLVIEPGQKVAFVGPSGVGKSTIVKLLFRLFEASKGNIYIDNITIGKLGKQGRQNIMAIVPQDPALFNSTIGDNIRFAKPNATQEEIENSAKLASLDQFIQSLPDRYNTLVGERGVKLSGGEKQRVAIARAVIRNPKILVFDEATSSLDSKSERTILTALHKASKGRTTIAIAHRLSTINDYDIIHVLDKGAIVEKGTHQQLLKLNGLYAKLWKIQAKQENK
ncbi:MAG: ABC transporter, ATP-binding/permease protein [Berkelbacteria bacterium GW2011_GWA2_35_9]|uniref:ABC transporter, ATP-binding/permease protein n=1 Tax=Berkelbacteria bacterium GW2011_GWA2_35_9 TaxID=1618333 RepID=A0A0G0DGA0_9BACT|nr:MAG: ABC transporter, ATP-binding/permease protein [Berkelbacteria bacterium GW2011_GWA2_35_9]